MVELVMKMDDNCKAKITPEETTEVFRLGQSVVEEFRRAYPGSHIERVILDMHCKEEIECPQPVDQIVIEMQRTDDMPDVFQINDEAADMPCFGCRAFGDNDLCHAWRHAQDKKGNEGTGCLRLPAFKTEE